MGWFLGCHYLQKRGHYPDALIVEGLNRKTRGWINYFDIPKVSYAAMSKQKLRHYLRERLYRYYNRKSQRSSRLYGTQAFEKLIENYKLINPINYYVG